MDERSVAMVGAGFREVFRVATGHEPYPYQETLGEDGLPELVEVPTGLGKTAAVVVSWLYRRRFHADPVVRSTTPQRLALVLPMRVLVEQTRSSVEHWLANLELDDDIPVRVLMGGEPMRGPNDWRNDVARDSIVVGTIDMVLSRCLNRGFGESRFLWPIDFGLLNTGTHFVFDEVQLMGPALATTRQLQALRNVLGTAAPSSSTWMSATIDRSTMETVDAPMVGSEVRLGDGDLASERVTRRFRAAKFVRRLAVEQPKKGTEIADAVVDLHRLGTLTLVIVNTVDRAVAVHGALTKRSPEADLVLLHSRFRPRDRAERVRSALASIDPNGPGRIVVSTQVVEAGVDVSATTLVTEVAPWPSIVQRAGRCNRDGSADDATMVWIPLPANLAAPYRPADLDAAAVALDGLTGSLVDSSVLGSQDVVVSRPIQVVLRRRDLVELFDTTADLSGNDVDVSRFIREMNDLDVAVAWRDGIADTAENQSMPGRDERCPVPVGAFRDWLAQHPPSSGGRRGAWMWDSQSGEWVTPVDSAVRPGAVFLVDASMGGYTTLGGWNAQSSIAVDPVADALPAADDQSTGDDPVSVGSSWVSLWDHLADAERAAASLLAEFDAPGLSNDQKTAIVEASRLHDIGKAHEQFQQVMHGIAQAASVDLPTGVLLAKSGAPGRLRYGRRSFRHELASALCLLGEGGVALAPLVERDLVVYLVGAHHGRIRLGVRATIGDRRSDVADEILGVRTGDRLPSIGVPAGEIPASTLDIGFTTLGGSTELSWTDRALALRDRPDIGIFRLGFMEAIVRLADWRASADPTPLSLGGPDA